MEPDVRQALVTIYQDKRNQGEAEALQWLEKLGASQRYRVDVWASG